jgi:hypothetical protein
VHLPLQPLNEYDEERTVFIHDWFHTQGDVLAMSLNRWTTVSIAPPAYWHTPVLICVGRVDIIVWDTAAHASQWHGRRKLDVKTACS